MGLVSKKFYSLTRAPSLWRDVDLEFVLNRGIDEAGFASFVERQGIASHKDLINKIIFTN